MHLIADNLLEVRGHIRDAAEKAGRSADDITLLAVSKTWPVSLLREAVAAGIRSFGENRVQEAAEKIPQLPAGLDWHLIGHLQSNKVRKALPLFGAIHSIDSLDLARAVHRVAGEIGTSPGIYLQVNIAKEDRKFGFTEDEITSAFDSILELEHLEILGLMTVTPLSPDPEDSRPHYAALRQLRDRLVTTSGLPLPGLSMGMSNDYPVAVEEGATIVRVGSAIFGRRTNSPTTEDSANS